MKKLTLDDFLQKANETHGEKYDYYLVRYINSSSKVTIKCNECGNIFEQLANSHLQGIGCPNCASIRSSSKRRKYKLNENYFDNIDSEEKAYFLGFLWADGCNMLSRNRISISLHEKDYEILKKLNDLIFSGNFIQTIHKDKTIITHYIKGKPVKSSGDIVRLNISSKYMSNKLNDIGLIPRKSSTVLFPTVIPDNLIRHFIRGYFDGDGSLINLKLRNTFYIKIASSHSFCKSLREVIYNNIELEGLVYDNSNKYSTLILTGIHNTKLFCDWIYENSTIHMQRKYDKYLRLIERDSILQRAKYPYVYKNKKNNLWIADVYLGNKKTKRLGWKFPTEDDAYVAQQKFISINA